MRKIVKRIGMLALAALVGVAPAAAQDEAGFQDYLPVLRAQAIAAGVTQRTVDEVLPTLTLSQRTIDLDRQQPGGTTNYIPPFAPYRAAHVDAARINRGRTAYQAQRSRLERIERETGVPESIMIAIWGHETNYGSYTGNFDLARSLATLAYEGRRRALFTEEFIATLKMLDRGVPRAQLQGSWAGATGYPQFLPSIYLRLARDGDGDGRADIWTNEADTLASIANYFVNAGWRAGQPWGFEVSVPASLSRTAVAPRTASPRCPRVMQRQSAWKTVAEWRALGLAATRRPWPADETLAMLIEPDGPAQPAYLVTGNYRVILDYNCSNFYALSVGLLADAIEQ